MGIVYYSKENRCNIYLPDEKEEKTLINEDDAMFYDDASEYFYENCFKYSDESNTSELRYKSQKQLIKKYET